MENIANNLKSITQDIKVGVIRNEGMRNEWMAGQMSLIAPSLVCMH